MLATSARALCLRQRRPPPLRSVLTRAHRGGTDSFPMEAKTPPCEETSCKPVICAVPLVNPQARGVIVGTSHFMGTPGDIAEAIQLAGISSYGVAFCEASGPQLVRTESSGEDATVLELATENCKRIGAGHSFVIVLGEGTFPVSVLSRIKNLDLVATVHCATNNAVEVLVACTEQGRGIIGVVDGKSPPLGVESVREAADRHQTIRNMGYEKGL